MEPLWRLPVDAVHDVSASAGALSFVGGAGDFDSDGRIRHPGNLTRQIEGAVENIARALAVENCRLGDVVRLKVYYTSEDDDWHVIAALARLFPDEPMPVICPIPEPLQPFEGQIVQIQAIAQRGWRDSADMRVAARPVPKAARAALGGRAVTGGLRTGEFITLASRTAANADGSVEKPDDGVAQSHRIMELHEQTLAEMGAGMQDCVKMEGYFFGTTREEWAPLAEARASHFAEPGPPATVVPCQRLSPEGAVTKIDVMAMRQRRLTYDKYIPRTDSWPDRVWDWPLNLPYRQGISLRDTIWLGGQVPSEPFASSGNRMAPGDLDTQTRMTMSYIADLMRGFERSPADLKLMVCYYRCDVGTETTRRVLEIISACIGGVLPPITMVAKPMMHSVENTVEIWGIGQA